MTLAVVSAATVLLLPAPLTQVAVIVSGGAIGLAALGADAGASTGSLQVPIAKRTAIVALGMLAVLLVGLPLAAAAWSSPALARIDAFFRAGALVFGGGHVVLPLLQSEVVPVGWVSEAAFLAGYGAAQALPGPLFTFAAFLGTVMSSAPNGWLGALLCLVAVFVPSFLLVVGVLPFWGRLRQAQPLRNALVGVNAAVVGLLLAAFYDPVWTSAVRTAADFVLALGAFTLLQVWRLPPWLVVLLAAVAAWGVSRAG